MQFELADSSGRFGDVDSALRIEAAYPLTRKEKPGLESIDSILKRVLARIQERVSMHRSPGEESPIIIHVGCGIPSVPGGRENRKTKPPTAAPESGDVALILPSVTDSPGSRAVRQPKRTTQWKLRRAGLL